MKLYRTLPQESAWIKLKGVAAKIFHAKFDNLTLDLAFDKNFQKTLGHSVCVFVSTTH